MSLTKTDHLLKYIEFLVIQSLLEKIVMNIFQKLKLHFYALK